MVYGRRSHNTEHTRMLTGGRRGGGVLSVERSGSGSHWEERRRSSVLSGMRGKATADSWARRENSETVAIKAARAHDKNGRRKSV